MSKSHKPKLEELEAEHRQAVVSSLFEELDATDCKAVAIGLDMAASEQNWGLSVISLDSSRSKGQLHLLLPYRKNFEGFKKQCPVKPSSVYLRHLLSGLKERELPTAIAVDIPLGWPVSHPRFTQNWSAELGCMNGDLVKRDDFELRKTDQCFKKKFVETDKSASVLSVGTDKIACAAFEWAKLRVELSNLVDSCDVGFGVPANSQTVLFETYPAAFVRLNYPKWIKYKNGKKSKKHPEKNRTAKELRQGLTDVLLGEYRLDPCHVQQYLQQAFETKKSDAFDGFISALCAWDYMRHRRDSSSHTMTFPETMLNEPLDDELEKTIRKEGWILTRKSAFKTGKPLA